MPAYPSGVGVDDGSQDEPRNELQVAVLPTEPTMQELQQQSMQECGRINAAPQGDSAAVLNVSADADSRTLKRAMIDLMLMIHPDKLAARGFGPDLFAYGWAAFLESMKAASARVMQACGVMLKRIEEREAYIKWCEIQTLRELERHQKQSITDLQCVLQLGRRVQELMSMLHSFYTNARMWPPNWNHFMYQWAAHVANFNRAVQMSNLSRNHLMCCSLDELQRWCPWLSEQRRQLESFHMAVTSAQVHAHGAWRLR